MRRYFKKMKKFRNCLTFLPNDGILSLRILLECIMKKISYFALFLLLLFCFCLSFTAEETTAKNLASKDSLSIERGSGSVSSLLDGKVTTSCKAKDGGFTLRISADEGVYGIYLIWNHTPPSWSICGENARILGGEYGFWHEYKALDGGASYTLSWEGEGTLADVYLLSEGDLPDYVQVWEPPCEKADFLLLPTHADDEHLWFGGTMPYYGGELGYKVQVVYLMTHVYGRHHELVNGLWEVGITNYPVIAPFIDKYCANLSQAKSYYPEEEVLEFQVEMIRRFRPEVIVGHDLKGEYGHGAHILNATVLSSRSVEAANDPAQFPESLEKYGIWQTKKLYLHLYEENKIFINWKEKILNKFDGKTAYEVAEAGFAQHKSQVAYFSLNLDNPKRYGCALFGLYSSTVGEDIAKNDFLENIPEECLTTYIPPEPIIPVEPEEPEIPVTDTVPGTDTENPIETNPSGIPMIVGIVILVVLMGFLTILLLATTQKKLRRGR